MNIKTEIKTFCGVKMCGNKYDHRNSDYYLSPQNHFSMCCKSFYLFRSFEQKTRRICVDIQFFFLFVRQTMFLCSIFRFTVTNSHFSFCSATAATEHWLTSDNGGGGREGVVSVSVRKREMKARSTLSEREAWVRARRCSISNVCIRYINKSFCGKVNAPRKLNNETKRLPESYGAKRATEREKE